jgi:hypothetical protein
VRLRSHGLAYCHSLQNQKVSVLARGRIFAKAYIKLLKTFRRSTYPRLGAYGAGRPEWRSWATRRAFPSAGGVNLLAAARSSLTCATLPAGFFCIVETRSVGVLDFERPYLLPAAANLTGINGATPNKRRLGTAGVALAL